jgi:pimeloyl-ACP methyl ester carboxylesterase
MATYREDMRRAWDRIDSFPRRGSRPASGSSSTPIAVMASRSWYPTGSLDATSTRSTAGGRTLPGRGSGSSARLGSATSAPRCPRTPPRPARRTPTSWLLDHLGVDRAVVIGFSAGSGSILEFARRHPGRVIGLILACCRLGGGITVGKAFVLLFRLAYSADPLFWAFKRLMPNAYSRMMGMPKGYQPSPQEAGTVAKALNLIFPLKPRREGAIFDGFVSNLAADRFPLEQLTVPTLVINARDDTTFAPYRFAATAADRIPGAKLVTIQSGGHWFIGHDADVREAIGAFVHELT